MWDKNPFLIFVFAVVATISVFVGLTQVLYFLIS